MRPRASSFPRDAAFAGLLALILTFAWVMRDRAALGALHLPDTDDAARLQQIRDWLAGQRFADLAQHRLGAQPGLEMHWSRLPDLVPGAIIALLTPLFGAHAAELTAAILWPAVLFALALTLVGSIARALGTSAIIAIVLAALAYPATTAFVPGRIDHHGLQTVLVLLLLRQLVGPGTLRSGVLAGVATVASLAIGLETAPLLAAGSAVVVLLWVVDGAGAGARLVGYAAALLASLTLAYAGLRTSGWGYPACDGFDSLLWRGAMLAALGPAALAATRTRFGTFRTRTLAAVSLCGGALAVALFVSPACLDPYGHVDPLLRRLWLPQVTEAQSLVSAPFGQGVAYAGLTLAGLAAAGFTAARRRTPGWWVLLAFQAMATAVTMVQLRGAYAAAMLPAPAFAELIAMARGVGIVPLALAWIASAGVSYALIGQALTPAARDGSGNANSGGCTGPAALAAIGALPPGLVVAPIDLGPYLLETSAHRVVAAPYHRNNAGNLAMLHFFLGDAAAARHIAAGWGIRYAAWCDDSFASPAFRAATAPTSVVAHAPPWLRPLPSRVPGLHLYAVTP